jgi:hypothetical protein
MLVSFPSPSTNQQNLLYVPLVLYMRNNFAFQLVFFLFVYFCFEAAKFRECSALGSSFFGVGVGNELRLGNDLLSTVKMGLGGDLESMGSRGDFVNCALLDLFFVSSTMVQISTLKLPPRFFVTCYGPGYTSCGAC